MPIEIQWTDQDPESGERRFLCAEKFATDCHRSLVAAYLADRYGAETQDL